MGGRGVQVFLWAMNRKVKREKNAVKPMIFTY